MKRTVYLLLLLAPLLGSCTQKATRPLTMDREAAEPTSRFLAATDTTMGLPAAEPFRP